jgi:hypothetical protein
VEGVKVYQIKGKSRFAVFFSFLFLLLVSRTYINCCVLLEVRVFVVALFCIFVVVRFVALLVLVMLFYFKVLDPFG